MDGRHDVDIQSVDRWSNVDRERNPHYRAYLYHDTPVLLSMTGNIATARKRRLK
jgi:hypothetical protein